MKLIFSFAIIFFTLFFDHYQTNAQAPTWIWARSAGETSSESGFSIATDAADNIYVTGVYQSTNITFGSTTLSNAGNSFDIFVVKYNGAGNVIWAYGGGGVGVDYGNSISTDLHGNVFVTGTFTSNITFGSTTLSTTGADDIFIAKFDSSGNVIWAKQAGGSNSDYSYNITADVNGNAFVSGNFTSDTITFGSIILTKSGFNDIFLVKYDSSGNVLWAKSNGSASFSGSRTDLAGNIYLTGSFYSSSLTFGSTVLTNADPSGSTSDLFIVKYDSAGNIIWARRAGGTNDDGASSIGIDSNANIFITGYFTSAPIAFGSTILNCGSTYGDIFLAKYDSAGIPLWAKRAGGTYNQVGTGISTDAGGNAYVTGMFQSATCSFNSVILTNAGATGDEDIFVAKYDAIGNVVWAISAGGVPQDVSWDICTNANGNAYITGYFWSPAITFGSTTLTNAGGPSSGDIFVAKVDYSTGIAEQSNFLDELNIFPNPATHEFKIRNEELSISGIDVYNVLGELVTSLKSEISNPKSEIEVNVSQLSPGIYFVQIQSMDFRETKKLIIAK